MCSNPFGGFDRLDRIDLFAFASGSDSPEKMLHLAIIRQAVQDYLYYGLGQNGTVADEFFYSHEYLFVVRSYIPETWHHARIIHETSRDEVTGKRTRRTVHLTDRELKHMCFDQHYSLAEMDGLMPFDVFVKMLEEQRLEILAQNWDQVCEYLKVANEYETLQELVRPSKIPSRRRRATISMPANQQEPLASCDGSNNAKMGVMEAA